ncbi:MAG: hypothetical protein EBZ50_16415, partial [Alphaproteobacteria bacterium]|nr:hypothetical protein [Alphaproteobacteria bacterium]
MAQQRHSPCNWPRWVRLRRKPRRPPTRRSSAFFCSAATIPTTSFWRPMPTAGRDILPPAT